MPSRPNPGIEWAKFILMNTADGKEWGTDFWFSVSAGAITASTNFAAITSAFYTLIATQMANVTPTTNTVIGCFAYFNDGTGTYGIKHYENTPGVNSTAVMPEDVAALVRKEVAGFHNYQKGRWFFSNVSQNLCDGSYLSAAGLATYVPLAIACKTAVTAGTLTLSPAHFAPKTGLLYPIVDTPVISLLSTQRKRRGRF